MDENIIHVSNDGTFRTSSWKMIIDLDVLVKDAGRRCKDQYNGGSFVSIPIPRAKKLLQLIREYGSEQDLQKVDRIIVKHEKLGPYWEKLREGKS